MEKVIKTVDLSEVVFADPDFEKIRISKTRKVEIVRSLFDLINSHLDGVDEGKVKIQGFGNFIIRNVKSVDSDKITRRIVFRAKESS